MCPGLQPHLVSTDSIGSAGQGQLLSLRHHAMPAMTSPYSQASFPIELMHSLVVAMNAFSLNQGMQSAVAKAATLVANSSSRASMLHYRN
jgi:hypothetical protein